MQSYANDAKQIERKSIASWILGGRRAAKIWKQLERKVVSWINMWIAFIPLQQLTWLTQHFESLQNDCVVWFPFALIVQMAKISLKSTFCTSEKKSFSLIATFTDSSSSIAHKLRRQPAPDRLDSQWNFSNLTSFSLRKNCETFPLNARNQIATKTRRNFFVDLEEGKIDFPATRSGASSDERKWCARTYGPRVEHGGLLSNSILYLSTFACILLAPVNK